MEFKEPNILKLSYQDPCKTKKIQYKYLQVHITFINLLIIPWYDN